MQWEMKMTVSVVFDFSTNQFHMLMALQLDGPLNSHTPLFRNKKQYMHGPTGIKLESLSMLNQLIFSGTLLLVSKSMTCNHRDLQSSYSHQPADFPRIPDSVSQILRMPCNIIHQWGCWNQNHFGLVICIKIRRNSYSNVQHLRII